MSAGSSENSSASEEGADNSISKLNQNEKESETTAINASTANTTAEKDESTKQSDQRTLTVANSNKDTKVSTTKIKPGIQVSKTNMNKGLDGTDGQEEDVTTESTEIEWLVFVMQETIRIITRIRELLSVFARINIFTFLK